MSNWSYLLSKNIGWELIFPAPFWNFHQLLMNCAELFVFWHKLLNPESSFSWSTMDIHKRCKVLCSCPLNCFHQLFPPSPRVSSKCDQACSVCCKVLVLDDGWRDLGASGVLSCHLITSRFCPVMHETRNSVQSLVYLGKKLQSVILFHSDSLSCHCQAWVKRPAVTHPIKRMKWTWFLLSGSPPPFPTNQGLAI